MQLSLFGGTTSFKIDKPIRLIELFGGISCQAQALLNLGVDFENYRYCDFDKYACQSHNEIMGTNDKPSDITKWEGGDLGICDTDKYCYIMTYSFPCTDLSTAGKMAGMERGSGTRSGLLWEVERLLKECNELPQVLLMENVPQVHGKKNKASFDEWCQFLESLGYKNYWKDLNAKDYGVPQSRNRCFMVSLQGDYSYEFPEPIELKFKLQDLLEDEVDEKYYLSDKMIAYLDKKVEQGWKKTVINNTEIANTICNPARNQINDNWIADKEIKLNQVAQITDKGFTEMTGRVYDSNGLSPTIQTMQGGNRQPKIAVNTFVRKKYNEFIAENGYMPYKFNPYNKAEINDIAPTQSTQCGSTTSSSAVLLKQELCNKLIQEGKVKENDVIRHNYTTSKNGNYIQSNNESPTLDTRCDCLGVCKDYRIRKLTPKECLRLMGVRDEYSKRMTCSNAQKYKQAGNGIVVDVLMAIFKKML